MVCAEGTGLSKGQGADGFWELESSEGHVQLARSNFCGHNKIPEAGFFTKKRSTVQDQADAYSDDTPRPVTASDSKGDSHLEKWPDACCGLTL